MRQHAVAVAGFVACLWLAGTAAGLDPHLDPGLIPLGCAACHEGHGQSGSPMLPAPQKQVCMACHESQVRLDQQVQRGAVSPSARPPFLSTVLSQPFTHPVSDLAYSELESGEVTCSSCHSPHRQMAPGRSDAVPTGRRYLSPKSPTQLEVDLCGACHGSRGGPGVALLDVGSLLAPSNRSYHPVEAPAPDRSPSVLPPLSGREINCTDCHGNSNVNGPRGPHGSTVPFVLRSPYTLSDGIAESADTYALCYRCHQRQAVLDSASFPEHRLHIVEERASCGTCHNPHGSVGNRALIRFGEDTTLTGVSPSAKTGRLAFESTGPGSGACYLSCHGEDHAPETYGTLEAFREGPGSPSGAPGVVPLPRGTASPPPPLPRREPSRRPVVRPPGVGQEPQP